MSNRKGYMHPERAKAFKLGHKDYSTGEACVNGHIDKRSTATGQCHTCRREQKRAFDKRRNTMIKSASEIEHKALSRSLPEGYITGARIFLSGRKVDV